MKVIKIIAYAILLFITQVLGDVGTTTNPSSGKVIVVLGDETATGIAKSLGVILSNQSKFRVVDSGKYKEITMFSMARLDEDVLSLSPSVVVISVGRNDLVQGRDTFESKLDLAIIKARVIDSGASAIVIDTSMLGSLSEVPSHDTYNKVASNVYENIAKFFQGKPKTPVPEIELVSVPGKIDRCVVIRWNAENKVYYEIIKPYSNGTNIGWNVIVTVRGSVGDTEITLPATEQVELFRLRAIWEQ